MTTQFKLILATTLSFVLLSATTAIASENDHDNADNHHALKFNGGNESDAAPAVKTNKDKEHHALKFNGGNEGDSGVNVPTQTDTDHHKEVTDPLSADYLDNK